VLGVSGVHTIYNDTQIIGPSSTAIFSVGYTNYSNITNQNDTIARSSLMRWGNYDTVNAAGRWLSSEVPTTGIPFINGNPVPATQSLPASFFLLSKPSWWTTPWGTPASPHIGPDVTGGNVSGYGRLVYKMPARLCFENTANDPAYSSVPAIKLFNASNCYAAGGGAG